MVHFKPQYKRVIHIGKNTIVTHKYAPAAEPPRGVRGEIVNFSRAARARLAFIVSETDVEFKTFVTLTYPEKYTRDGKEVKRHLNRWLSMLRWRHKNVEYLWFLEFQKRGAPHVHIMLDVGLNESDAEHIIKKWCDYIAPNEWTWKKMFYVHWQKEPRAVEKIKKKDGAKRYALKYALKTYQKVVPDDFRNVGRFYGYSKGVSAGVRVEDFAEVEIPEGMGIVEYLSRVAGVEFEPEFVPKFVWIRQQKD